MILPSLLFVNCSDSGKVLKFKGGSVSLKEVDDAAKMELFRLKKNEFEIRMNAARTIMDKKILEAEAQEEKKSVKDLLEDFYQKNKPSIPDAQLEAIFNENKEYFGGGGFAKHRDRLLAELDKQQKIQIKSNYISSLYSKYDVQFILKKPEAPAVDIKTDGDPYWGPKDAKVVIVEFSDFECPYCKKMQPTINRIKEKYSDKVKWVFKDFPLSFHKQAMKAHMATRCAQKQNKYWEYQQIIFNQPYGSDRTLDLSENFLLRTATVNGLDMTKFKTCLADKDAQLEKQIKDSIEYSSSALGVNSTPSFFINGEYASDMRSFSEIENKIKSLL